jgi:pyruvate dehydrogenase E2 component (dihydrolipoamide acetyltransferase)
MLIETDNLESEQSQLVYEFKLPDLGEGVAEAEVLKWMVKEGDKIAEDQPLVEVMTDKVNVQIPAPRTGSVTKILVKEGDMAKVGQTIVVIDDGGTVKEPQTPPPRPPTSQAPPAQAGPGVPAAPATRKLARELGVDIAKVRGSGPSWRVTDDDVRHAVSSAPAVATQTPRPMAQGAREEVVALRGVRRAIAEHMVKSKEATAQVTHVDDADVTELVLLREAFKGSAEKRGVKLTFLPFIMKALVPALKEFPYVNSSLDETTGSIVLKKYYNIGVATDTEQGLVVPVIKDVDSKDIFELAGEVEKAAEKARNGQLSLDDVKGSTFTITNVGAIGGLFATPIVNYPEVAILGLHKIAKRPVVRDARVEIRDMTYLSLSFDHRVFDGAYAARFTARLIETLQDTRKLLSEVL